jgi:hypothetical protein
MISAVIAVTPTPAAITTGDLYQGGAANKSISALDGIPGPFFTVGAAFGGGADGKGEEGRCGGGSAAGGRLVDGGTKTIEADRCGAGGTKF